MMRRTVRWVALAAGALALLGAAGWLTFIRMIGSDNPRRFERHVRELEQKFADGFPQGGVLITGSSYVEFWTTSAADLAPLDTTNIGIGGTKAGDHLAYLERMVIPFHPRTLIVYIGSNDINGLPLYSKTSTTTVALVKSYIERVRALLPETRIYYIAITETPSRARVRNDIREANRQLAQLSRETGDFTFIDTAPALLTTAGEIDPSLFRPDRLHLNLKGYAVFAAAIRVRIRSEYVPGAGAQA